MLDTNIAIRARDGDEAVLGKLQLHQGDVLLSALSLAELQRGVFKYPINTTSRQARLAAILDNLPVVPFDEAAALNYGQIIAALGWVKGRDFDRMIAAHAITVRAVLVTSNASDFRDIPRLQMEDWSDR